MNRRVLPYVDIGYLGKMTTNIMLRYKASGHTLFKIWDKLRTL